MDLYRIRLDSHETLRLTHEDGAVWGPAFSPDGREIVFVSSLGGYPSLAVIPVAGGTTRRITNTTLPTDGTPVHSSRLAPFPEGRRGPLWTDEGFVFENREGVFRVSRDGTITGHWPGVRFPVVTRGMILVHDGRSLVPLADPEVIR
jgi:Tol biopolymer transport system component